jgi:hypothetical protein
MGARLIWVCNKDKSNHESYWYDRTLETSRRLGMSPTKLMHVSGPMELAGESPLVVFTARGALWRLDGRRAVLLRQEKPGILNVWADRAFIALVRQHSIELVRNDGKLIHTFRLSLGEDDTMRVAGGRLVLQRRAAIAVYKPSGELEHRWQVQEPGPPAELVDARGRFAVYTVGIALRLLDLRTGHDVVLGLASQAGAPDAIFTGDGLAYLYAVAYAAVPYRAGYLPLAQLRALLRSP